MDDGRSRSVSFVTVRDRTGSNDPDSFYGSDRSSRRAGLCRVSLRPYKALETIAANAPFYVPDEIMRLDAIEERQIADLGDDLERSSNERTPLLYVHSANMGFPNGCKRSSLFQLSLGLEGRFLLFSWLSDGAMLSYTRDESDVYWSALPPG